MSDQTRVVLVGATGLIGRAVMTEAIHRPNIHLVAVARRETLLPKGARMELLLSDAEHWPDAIAAGRPWTVIIALGTTMKAVGGDKMAFRSVDHDLVLECAAAAKAAGARQLIVVSSVGAQFSSKNFYLSVKGEVEAKLAKLHFDRLDIIRPGLLRGHREGPLRPVERLAMIFSPLLDLLMIGGWRKYRSVRDSELARVILSLAGSKQHGRHVFEHDDFRRVLHRR
ncbi:nucleoside-diphosphate sugar epimerase [Novosphingobium sp. AAP83]|uniref:NAD(P)H-binding protein n=1 Tax=Novosphingobium sp. AAP83 TaxID=1523425 RepID=UPI0006B90E65|nr:NAD(P)H-binding protein [Novosphingobium sp. AAP83]KPF91014.1 nucleoside-diphosphate sugar epimerase [Novosphingobium sp. AAP83]